jgi:hypothetical protein
MKHGRRDKALTLIKTGLVCSPQDRRGWSKRLRACQPDDIDAPRAGAHGKPDKIRLHHSANEARSEGNDVDSAGKTEAVIGNSGLAFAQQAFPEGLRCAVLGGREDRFPNNRRRCSSVRRQRSAMARNVPRAGALSRRRLPAATALA